MRKHGYLVLLRHREFRAVWTSSALGVAATTMSSLSLGTLVWAQTGSPFLTAATMFGLQQQARASEVPADRHLRRHPRLCHRCDRDRVIQRNELERIEQQALI
jgi:hypothetical protein